MRCSRTGSRVLGLQPAQRCSRQPGHPASLWIREDILLDLVHGFFPEHIFGSDGCEPLAAQLASHTPSPEADRTAERTDAPRRAISDIEQRRYALIAELEAQPGGGERPQQDSNLRTRLRRP
jgi:hypothetical protein